MTVLGTGRDTCIPSMGRLKEEDDESKTNLSYIVNHEGKKRKEERKKYNTSEEAQ